ncbi:ESX-1 secretion system protein EccCa1 [Elysia marginata]|uniref:ESX-1 secretion system protein EccCa1 n=1 Tax=Elysia marginata TaxID=1093978 RepID=A0AAV4I0S0_9GAST|nr:ESX-1 secretion system protein EccCa1 [Elysia marginata]
MKEIVSKPDTDLVPKDLIAIRQAMYRERRKKFPALPKTRQEVHEALQHYDITSNQGENMLHVNDTDSGIVIVTTRQNLEYLAIPDVRIFSDDIFKFLDAVTAFQAKVHMKIRATARPVVATKRIKQLQKKVDKLKQLFDEGKLEVKEYVHEIAMRYQPVNE